MNFQSIFKRETKLIVYVVSALTIVLIGSTYALFFRVKENTNNQVVQAGALVIEYSNNGNEVVAEGDAKDNNCLYPTDDEDGNLNGCSYTFTMTNNGSLPAEYTLYLTNDSSDLPENGKLLEIKNIKHTLRKKLVKDGEQTVEVNNAKKLSELGQDNEKGTILEKNVINVGESIEFSLRVWIDEDAPHEGAPDSIVGNYVRLKINASSTVYEGTLADEIKFLAVDESNITAGDSGIVKVNTESVSPVELNGLDSETEDQVEYRYYGSNPNNYVRFNDELWRIIGLVNTPEGQRVKIIKASPLDLKLSWPNANITENTWENSELQKVLNETYYNKTSGECTIFQNETCDFSKVGLSEEARQLVDSITWTLNSLTWKGNIALINLTDYKNATSGGETNNRSTCLSDSSWTEKQECFQNDWLASEENQLTLDAYVSNSEANNITATGSIGSDSNSTYTIYPALYLKSDVLVLNGEGSIEKPYILDQK